MAVDAATDTHRNVIRLAPARQAIEVPAPEAANPSPSEFVRRTITEKPAFDRVGTEPKRIDLAQFNPPLYLSAPVEALALYQPLFFLASRRPLAHHIALDFVPVRLQQTTVLGQFADLSLDHRKLGLNGVILRD